MAGVVSFAERYSSDGIYRLTAECETLSEHPLGRAVVDCWRKSGKASLSPVTDFQMIPGRGISGEVEGKHVLAGNRELLEENGITFVENREAEKYISEGCTAIYVAVGGVSAGSIALSDTLRPESRKMIEKVRASGVTPVLLTGDNRAAAETIASHLFVTEFRDSCLPSDKLEYIEECRRKGRKVCMIGDGINDAPALKSADVGIAMGGAGSDIAVDAADIALVDDAVEQLPHLLALSKKMMTTIKINMTFSMTLNFVAIILAIIGTLNPVVGALVHNAGSVLVITNSAMLLKWRRK